MATPADVAAWERLKLRMVNGAHSALAYLGVVAGWATVDVAIGQPALRRFIEAMLRKRGRTDADRLSWSRPTTVSACCSASPTPHSRTAVPRSRWTARRRSRNACSPPCATGSRAGASIAHLSLALAGWLHFLRGHDEAGNRYPIDDPLAAALQALVREGQAMPDARARAEP